MKTIPLESLGEPLTRAIEQQGKQEAIGLTDASRTVAWVVRVPEGVDDAVIVAEGPSGQAFVVVQVKHDGRRDERPTVRTPVFGAGRGTLTVLSEDDDHLKDFQEYMG